MSRRIQTWFVNPPLLLLDLVDFDIDLWNR